RWPRDWSSDVCSSDLRSRNLEAITRAADILIAAIGRAEFVKAKHVRDGAVIVDVGINRVEDTTSERGYRLIGDVDFDEVAKKARSEERRVGKGCRGGV